MSSNDEIMDGIDDIRYYLKEHLGFTEDVSEKVLELYIEDIVRKFRPTFSGLNSFVSDHIKISGIGQKEITVEYKGTMWTQEYFKPISGTYIQQKFNNEYLCDDLKIGSVDGVRFIDNDLKELNDKCNDALDALTYGMGITKVKLGK